MHRSIIAIAAWHLSVAATLLSPSNFTAPGVFPTSAFSKYYNKPTATSAQVQPVVSDPVTVTYSLDFSPLPSSNREETTA